MPFRVKNSTLPSPTNKRTAAPATTPSVFSFSSHPTFFLLCTHFGPSNPLGQNSRNGPPTPKPLAETPIAPFLSPPRWFKSRAWVLARACLFSLLRFSPATAIFLL